MVGQLLMWGVASLGSSALLLVLTLYGNNAKHDRSCLTVLYFCLCLMPRYKKPEQVSSTVVWSQISSISLQASAKPWPFDGLRHSRLQQIQHTHRIGVRAASAAAAAVTTAAAAAAFAAIAGAPFLRLSLGFMLLA